MNQPPEHLPEQGWAGKRKNDDYRSNTAWLWLALILLLLVIGGMVGGIYVTHNSLWVLAVDYHLNQTSDVQSLYRTQTAQAQIWQSTATPLALTAQANDLRASQLDTTLAAVNNRDAVVQQKETQMAVNIAATATAAAIVNLQQRTQAALDFANTQAAINQQATQVELNYQATSAALSTPQP
jgi:hypothetical protein